MKPMEEYNKQRKEQTDQLLEKVRKMHEEGQKQKVIADMLGLTTARVSQLIKKVK